MPLIVIAMNRPAFQGGEEAISICIRRSPDFIVAGFVPRKDSFNFLLP